MTWFLACPVCDKPITKLNDCDDRQVSCPGCRYSYRVVAGSLLNWSTRVEIPEPEKRRQARRHYELRLAQSEEQVSAIRITLLGAADVLPLCQGDQVAMISVVGRQQQEVIAFINRTAEATVQVAKPGQRSRRFAVGIGTIATVLSGSLLTLIAPHVVPLAWLVSLPLGVSAGVVARRRLQDQASFTASERDQLQHQTALLQQQVHLQQRLQSLQAELKAHTAVAQKFQVLKGRLADLPPDLQQNRLDLVNRVLVILEQQLEYDQQLITGYSQIIDALDIEYEATRLTAELPEELVLNFNRRLAELEVVEQQRQQLTAELALRKVAF